MNLKQLIKEYVYQVLQEDIKSKMEGRTDYFTPTKEWMEKWYNILNTELLGGSLPKCNLVVGKVGIDKIGYFKLSSGGLSKNLLPNGKHQVLTTILIDGASINVPLTPENVSDAKPKICLNTNYVADEYTWIAVLLHEMCHFYNSMRGERERDPHGQDFKEVVNSACSKSNGFFTPNKVLTSEEMNTKTVDDYDINKVKNRRVFLIIMKDNNVRLFPTSSKAAITNIITYFYCQSDKTKEVRELTKPDSLNLLLKYNFSYDIRSNKYYDLSNKFPGALEEFMACPYTEIYNFENATERTEEDENKKILAFMEGVKIYVLGMNGEKRMYLSRTPKVKNSLLSRYCTSAGWSSPNADYLYEYDNDELRIWFYKTNKKVSKPQSTTNSYWPLDEMSPVYKEELEKYKPNILFSKNNDY